LPNLQLGDQQIAAVQYCFSAKCDCGHANNHRPPPDFQMVCPLVTCTKTDLAAQEL
jgi:hypothetical protein